MSVQPKIPPRWPACSLCRCLLLANNRKLPDRLTHGNIQAFSLGETKGADPDYATAPARSTNRDALNAAIEKLTVKKSTETWVSELNAAGVPCGPIYSIDQMFEDAQVKHLGIAQDVPNDENRHIRLVGQPITLSRTPSRMVARPPEFGEQTEEVLAEFGYGADEIAALKQAKVV
jgi:crotonobetainyl-CoA:carnitine CoA-transferase CaiB-like acyl-CoA transferase